MTTRTARLLVPFSLVLLAACSARAPEAVEGDDLFELPPTSSPVGAEQPSADNEQAAPAEEAEASVDGSVATGAVAGERQTTSRDQSRLVQEVRREVAAEAKKESPARYKAAADADEAYAMDLPAAPAARPTNTAASGRAAPQGSVALGGAVSGPVATVLPPAEPVPAEVITTYGSTEGYTDHGVNPFTMVTDDALSTFSIDVDTASYAIARKKLEAGALPPPEAVRVEEFVNYLDYRYTGPSAGNTAPFAVHMATMPDPFRDGRHILRVGVQAREISRDERPPMHLTFLVDVSGSMSSSDKLPLAKQSMHMLVDSLREDDTVALATYAGRVAKILEPTDGADKARIHQAIESLSSGGSTAMSSGIDLAYEMAWESFEPGHENRVVILSDGDANVGRTSWDDMLSQIKGYADRGVTLSTIGLGMGNYQDTLMEQLSNKGDGNNYYIDDADQAQRVFVEDLGGTMLTVARDVKLQVEFNEDSVLAYRLLGYENRDIADRDFRNDKVDAGEVGAGHNVTALYEVILAEGYDRELATVRVRWEEPGADVGHGGSGGRERAYTFRDSDLAETTSMAPRTLRMAYATATFAEVLRHSPAVQELSMDALIAYTKSSVRRGEADDAEVVALMEKARSLGLRGSGAAVSVR